MPGMPSAFHATLLSCQHFLHGSVDILASRLCDQNAALRAALARPPPDTELLATLMPLPGGPTFRILFSPPQSVRANQDLQETVGQGPEGAGIKADQTPAWETQPEGPAGYPSGASLVQLCLQPAPHHLWASAHSPGLNTVSTVS